MYWRPFSLTLVQKVKAMRGDNRKEIEDWVTGWWRSPERPGQIEKGQVWTVFAPGADPEAEGTMVCVLSKDDDYVYVIPLHNNLEAATGCEPVIRGASLPYAPALVAVVELGLLLSVEALTRARFLGTLSREHMDLIETAFLEFRKIVGALTQLQVKEGECHPEPVPQDDLERAFQAGILKLVSPDASMEEIVRLDASLQDNLHPFHLQAMASLSLMPEAKEAMPPKVAAQYAVEDGAQVAETISGVREDVAPWQHVFPAVVLAALACIQIQKMRLRRQVARDFLGPLGPLEGELDVPTAQAPSELDSNITYVNMPSLEAGGKQVKLLPVDPPPKELAQCLDDFRDDFVHGGIIYGMDSVLGHWYAEIPSGLPATVQKDVPPGTAAILLGLCRDVDRLRAAIDSIISGKKTRDDSVFWILYHTMPEK